MKIKRTAAILAACMGISLLAGCGDDNQKIFEQADKDLAQGSYEYARDGYLTSVKNKVKLPLSYRGAGIASLRLGDYQDAIQILPVPLHVRIQERLLQRISLLIRLQQR